MPALYVATYIVPQKRELPLVLGGVVSAFHQAVSLETAWPYDVGDDPAFFSANHFHGSVTWGVCRPDVRNQVVSGDWVAFFAAERAHAGRAMRYRFSALLRVEKKVAQTSLSASDLKPGFQSYLNLLIRPSGTGWEHFEPAAQRSSWHRDWLWRLCTGNGLRKADAVAAGDAHRAGTELTINGRSAPIAANYVIFSKEESLVVENPPVLANYHQGDRHETWVGEQRSRGIRELLLGDSQRWLRTTNRQQPHRHIRRVLPSDVPSWRNAIEAATKIEA